MVNQDYNRIDLLRDIITQVRKLKDDSILEEPLRFLSIFPPDIEFEKDTIVELWMACGFLDNLSLTEEPYTIEFETLEKLHYLLPSGLDLFTQKPKYKVNFAKLEDFNQGRAFCFTHSESCHVSLLLDHIDDSTIMYLNKFKILTTLLVFPNNGSFLKQLPSHFLTTNKFLKALHLSGSRITELPTTIQFLTHLRYLDLSYTLIARLPESIDSLHKLQTLKLVGCHHLFELPDGISKLKSLRYLHFDVLGQLTRMPKGFGALTELQILSAFKVDNRDSCNIRELKSLINLRGSCCISGLQNVPPHFVGEPLLKNKVGLTHLELRWYPYTQIWKGHAPIIEDLKPSPSLEELQILRYPGSSLPNWMADEEFRMLARISLLDCENFELDIPLGVLPKLKELEIIETNNVIRLDDHLRGSVLHQVAFRKLEKLTIYGMHNLETWDGMQMCDFPCLSMFAICQCPKIATLPFLPFLRSLKHLEISYCGILDTPLHHNPSLETLIIYCCPLLKKRYSNRGEDWDEIKHVQNIWIDEEDAHIDEQSIHSEDEYTSGDDSFTTDSNLDYFEESNVGEIRDEEEEKDSP